MEKMIQNTYKKTQDDLRDTGIDHDVTQRYKNY